MNAQKEETIRSWFVSVKMFQFLPNESPIPLALGEAGCSTSWTLRTSSWNLGSKQPLVVDVWLLKSLTSKKQMISWFQNSRMSPIFFWLLWGLLLWVFVYSSGFLTKFSIPGSGKSPELPWWSKIQPVHRHERLKTEVATYSFEPRQKTGLTFYWMLVD